MRASQWAAASLVVLGGCTAPNDKIQQSSVVATVAISPSNISAQVGKTVQLTATVRDSAGTILSNRSISWSSSDTVVGKVSTAGMFAARSPGSAVIHATVGDKEASASASVVPVPVASVAVAPASPTVQVGGSIQFTAATRDASGNTLSGRLTTWSSSNTAAATIDASGRASALAAGTTNIVATSEGITGQTSMTVTTTPPPPPAPVASVSVTLASSNLTIGQTTQATAVTKDASGHVLTGRSISWSSSNSAVASVNANGLVSALAQGTATITATSEGVSGSGPITITIAPVASVVVTLTPSTVIAGQTAQATAVLKDAQGNVLSGRTIAWSSSNTAVATVAANGLVTSVAAGSASITATSEGKSGSTGLTVNAVSSGVDTLFVDHFDSGTLGDAGRWQDIVSNGASIASAAAEGITAPSGANVLKLTADGAAISHFVSTAATSPYEHLYLSWRMYRSSAYEATNHGLRSGGIRGSTTQWGSYGVGWGTAGSCPSDPNNVHQQEFMFAYVSDDPSNWAVRAYTNWIGEQKLTTNPPTCGGGFAMSAGDNPQATYFDVNFAPPANSWHQYEIEVQLNTVGQSNGWQRIWVDGVLKVEHANVMYRTTSGMKLWAVTFDTGTLTGSGAYYVDDVVVATKRP